MRSYHLAAFLVYQSLLAGRATATTTLLRKNEGSRGLSGSRSSRGSVGSSDSNDLPDPSEFVLGDTRGSLDPVESMMMETELDWVLREMDRYQNVRGVYPLRDSSPVSSEPTSAEDEGTEPVVYLRISARSVPATEGSLRGGSSWASSEEVISAN